MKLKLSLATAAVAMAFAGQAAAIDSPTTGNGGLFLTAWDSTVGATQGYARDLGITMDAFLANPNVDLSFAADALFVSTFAGVDQAAIRWNITAGDRVVDPNRLLSTAVIDPGSITNGALNGGILARQIPMVDDLNARTLSGLGSVAVTDPADPQWPGGPNWGTNFGGNILNINNAGGVGGSLGFYLISQVGLTETSLTVQALREQLFVDGGVGALTGAGVDATWTLGANGAIAYDGAGDQPPAVPIPAAVWLFGSGLLGLVGVARRKNKPAA